MSDQSESTTEPTPSAPAEPTRAEVSDAQPTADDPSIAGDGEGEGEGEGEASVAGEGTESTGAPGEGKKRRRRRRKKKSAEGEGGAPRPEGEAGARPEGPRHDHKPREPRTDLPLSRFLDPYGSRKSPFTASDIVGGRVVALQRGVAVIDLFGHGLAFAQTNEPR